MKAVVLTVVAMLAAMALSVSAIKVCDRCSYELNEGAVSCSHCGAPVAASAAPVKATGADGEAGNAVVSADLVVCEVQEGHRQKSKGDEEVAAALFRNAMALEQVVPGSGKDRGERIRRLLQDCDASGLKVQGKCQACGGTGKTAFTADLLGGETASVAAATGCRVCGGSGRMVRNGTASEVIAARSQALKRYAALQQSRKYVAVGGAWVPVSIETNLTIRQVALLKRTAAPPCQTCLGLGVRECGACRGIGRQPCSNRKCVKGVVSERPPDTLKGTELVRKVKCRVCEGTGFEACAGCTGRGSVACTACGGKGERPVCDGCDGSGTLSCTKCSGTGTYRGQPCMTCRGEGIMLCGRCKGDGRKR